MHFHSENIYTNLGEHQYSRGGTLSCFFIDESGIVTGCCGKDCGKVATLECDQLLLAVFCAAMCICQTLFNPRLSIVYWYIEYIDYMANKHDLWIYVCSED